MQPPFNLPPTLARAGGVAALACGVLALAPGGASAASSSLTAEGLHISTGALVDPDGRTWVSDHNAGFCRVSEPSDSAPGQIEHPQRPGDGGPRTCLGGLLPEAATGPDAAGAPVLVDPTPAVVGNGDEVALIPDGASPSSDVVRARWNPDTGLFEFEGIITMLGDRVRPTSLALGPDEHVYAVFQRSGQVQRISDPAGTPSVAVVGATSDRRGAGSVAAGRDADGDTVVYVAEGGGLTELRPDPALAPVAELSNLPLPAVGATTIGALAYDLERDLLYVGTANGVDQTDEGEDVVHRLATREGGMVATELNHLTGFSMIGGLSVRPTTGHVMVVDDPALLDPAEPLGAGRMFRAGRPGARVVSGPPAAAQERSPSFRVAGDAGSALECRVAGTWSACSEDEPFVPAAPLADGSHTFSVRARVGSDVGVPAYRRFRVDNAAPLAPVVTSPANGSTTSSRPWYEFTAESGARLVCSIDERELAPCSPGRGDELADGEHTVVAQAVDAAGNVSLPSDAVRFTTDGTLEEQTPVPWGSGTVQHRGRTLFAGGLHIATGSVVDPTGRIWVADHNGGFCRLTDPSENGAGAIDHPATPGADGPRTCLGGLLPEAGTGPDAAGQPALIDPTPSRHGSGDEVVLIPDGASPSSDVVRARWNPGSRLFEYLDTVTMTGVRARPVAVSAGPLGEAYVVFQRSGTIERINGAAGNSPSVDVVGQTSDGRRAGAVAAGRNVQGQDVLYVAEDAGLRVVRPNAATRPVTQAVTFTVPGAGTASALVYDRARDHLYVGTANGTTEADAGTDQVHRFRITGSGVATDAGYVQGLSMVGGLGLRPDGALHVVDDPALLDPAEPLGTGRLFHVGLPAAHVTSGPQVTRDRRPVLRVSGEGTIACRLGGIANAAWAPCPPSGQFRPADTLVDGNYVLAVRSTANGVQGLPETHRFTVDNVAPAKPVITSPNGTETTTPWFAFEAEQGATFRCRFDGNGNGNGQFTACLPGRTRTMSPGSHRLSIQAVDAAGNVSATSDEVRFTVVQAVSEVTFGAGSTTTSADGAARFTFAADVAVTGYQCRLAGRAWGACSSPASYSGLADGAYTFEVYARDALGNASAVARRAFTVARPVTPNTPVAQPGPTQTPTQGTPGPPSTVLVIDRLTAQPVTIRIADIDRRVKLDLIQQAGVQVTVIPPRGAKQIRFRIFRVGGGGQNRGGRAVAAKAAKALVATEHRSAKAGKRMNVSLKSKAVRKLRPGRYVLEVTTRAKGRFGKPVSRTFEVRR